MRKRIKFSLRRNIVLPPIRPQKRFFSCNSLAATTVLDESGCALAESAFHSSLLPWLGVWKEAAAGQLLPGTMRHYASYLSGPIA